MALILPTFTIAQISPGPLSRAHQSLEGPTQCAKCHGTSAEAMPRLCLACHKELEWLVAQRRGLHAREAKTSGTSCASCHPEHAGRAFEMIAWPAGGELKFDHRGAGWPLEGKHAAIGCAKCHRSEFRTGPAAALSPRKGSAGWVGLERTCVSCHGRGDPHANSLGPACQQCHNVAGWIPAPKFDHAQSRYPLTGKHSDVSCGRCHLAASLNIPVGANGKRVPRFKPLSFAECSTCHADLHRGQFAAKCSTCHVTRGFDVIDRRDFNHATTRYPLLGKHRTASCESCHGRGMAKPKPAFETCAACHANVHDSVATLARARVDCAACHRVDGFTPATFTIAQHQRTRFPLNGEHEHVACAACHTRTTAAGSAKKVIRLKFSEVRCAACHSDPHRVVGVAAARDFTTECESCHTSVAFRPTTIGIAAHARFAFPLEGAHRAVPCATCHTTFTTVNRPRGRGGSLLGAPRPIGGVALNAVRGTTCAACHQTPHGTQFSSRADGGRCDACHGSDAFAPAPKFNHDRDAAFALAGAHRPVACASCHRTETVAGVARVTYRPVPHRCEDCHAVKLRGTGG
jgi:hypothetical protein